MPGEADLVWRIFAAASIAAISRTLPRGAQSPGPRQPDLISFAAGSKKEQRSSAVSRTTGRSAEVLREGSGIESTGPRALGSQSAHILRIPGMSHRKKTSRPDLSSRQAGQCVLAQGGDYNRTSFFSIRVADKHYLKPTEVLPDVRKAVNSAMRGLTNVQPVFN
jgi:hypothetical protein